MTNIHKVSTYSNREDIPEKDIKSATVIEYNSLYIPLMKRIKGVAVIEHADYHVARNTLLEYINTWNSTSDKWKYWIG